MAVCSAAIASRRCRRVDSATRSTTAPYAALKQVHDLTPELAAACAKKWIVVSGVLTTDGKLEKLRVMKSPDPAVNNLVMESLSNWAFQPSQLDGKPVALQILLGIRLVTH